MNISFRNIRVDMWILLIVLSFSSLQAQITFPYQSSYKYLKGSQASGLPSNWMSSTYSVAGWTTGSAPFRYGDGSGGTELTDMMNTYSTVYVRTTFNASNVASIRTISLTVNFDDAFVIWINGEEVLRQNAPQTLSYNGFATAMHEVGEMLTYVINASDFDLWEGQNTIAIQGFNISLESTDFYFDLNMSASLEYINTVGISFSHEAGFYSSPFNLTLTSPDSEADIIYTLNGSNPQNSTSSFNGGQSVVIPVDPASTTSRGTTPGFVVRASLTKAGLSASIPTTRTYIFISNVITQSYPGYDWPASNVQGEYQSDIQQIYLPMDSRVTGDSRYSALMDDALLDIPTIAVATHNKNLFDTLTGIYVNAEGHGIGWERECSVELIDPDGSDEFNVNAGLRIRGGWSRHGYYPKHAFRLFFREDYGESKLRFPLFEDEGVSEYDKIDLRCEQNYAWANGDNRNTLVREVFSRDLQREMNQPYTRSRYYHLYLNGMYWGVYQTQERSEARYAADYLGGEADEYDVIKVNTEDYTYRIEATDGGLENWQKIYNYCNSGFATNESYFRLEGKGAIGTPKKGSEVLVNIDNLIDYMLGIFYTGNFDAPTSSFGSNKGPNNFYIIKNRNDKSEGFIFINHDAEHAIMVENTGTGIGINEDRVNIGTRTDGNQMTVSVFDVFHPQWLHFKLCDNAEYRMRFADRAYLYMTGNGIMTPSRLLALFNSRAAEIETAVIAESARWGAAQGNYPYTKDDNWLPVIQQVRNQFFPVRTNIVINQLKSAGLYSTLTPPGILISGNPVLDPYYIQNTSLNLIFDNTNSGGIIYYTLNGNDPRLIGGGIASGVIEISDGGSLNINSSAVINARVYDNGSWSALKTLTLVGQSDDFTYLKVTELNYHPKDSIVGSDTIGGDDYEFIEFKNTGTTGINLSGLVLDSAVYYEFPANVVLLPGKFYVVAAKPSRFYEYYNKVASGNYQGNFANSGEQVLLRRTTGETVIVFTYEDQSPWPEEADGTGYSMVSLVFNPTRDADDPDYWRSSLLVDGSPFKDDDGIIEGVPEGIIPADALSLYPNPASGSITVTFAAASANEQIDLQLFGLNGVLIHESYISNNEVLDLNALGLQPGMYLIKVRTNEFTETRKLIYTP